MATSPENIIERYLQEQSENLDRWLSPIGEIEGLIDKAVDEKRGGLKAETEEGRLRLSYTFRLSGPVVQAVAESPIATEDLQRRYREAGFESLTLKSEGLEGATVELVAYDASDETEDQRLTRLLAQALRRKPADGA